MILNFSKCNYILVYSNGLNLAKEATACRGEADLCHDLNGASRGCEENDVICQLMHKVRNYLRTHYNDEQRQPPRPNLTPDTQAIAIPANRPQRRKVLTYYVSENLVLMSVLLWNFKKILAENQHAQKKPLYFCEYNECQFVKNWA